MRTGYEKFRTDCGPNIDQGSLFVVSQSVSQSFDTVKTPHFDSAKNFVTHFVTLEFWIRRSHLQVGSLSSRT